MSAADNLDPYSSVLGFFATDLRRRRERARVSQRRLAQEAGISASYLNKIESAQRLPTERLAVVSDAIFRTEDHYRRLWPLVIKYAYPPWFRPFVELEEQATRIRSFEAQVVPGLLQTEAYARAVLSTSRADVETVEEQVTARLQRQRILEGADAPRLWAILDENVLRRCYGSRAVMREQLNRLVAAADNPRVVVQVIPYSVGGHAGVAGPFAILHLDSTAPDVVMADGFREGRLLGDAEDLAEADRTYDLLLASSASPDASLDMIAAASKELST
ncbi:Scr1 family TA system antitoxin-like transcriptional regulator [Streptomyces rimosus]|uniref:helix-turn-helix domain-containing protein n=1 Tax=Streptomyces rimosus TaxID=1927 RepID=UPI00051939FB|nr:Scr1 family TA system antitoxin-like transcriptional regulator [Streptomyces rimosus]